MTGNRYTIQVLTKGQQSVSTNMRKNKIKTNPAMRDKNITIHHKYIKSKLCKYI